MPSRFGNKINWVVITQSITLSTLLNFREKTDDETSKNYRHRHSRRHCDVFHYHGE